MDACKACSRNFVRSERTVLCSGSCGKVFHPGCVGLNATNFKAWTANVGLLWFCENCRVNFNPCIMDREAIIIKTMRDLLLRVDSMDLRIGQYGENLKTLNSLLTVSTFNKRDSNFSSRMQQFVSSGSIVHDPTEFHNSIDRFNFDMSLISNPANNTVAEDDLEAALNSDDVETNRVMNVSQNCHAAATTTATTHATTAAVNSMLTAPNIAAAANTVTNAAANASSAPTYATVASIPVTSTISAKKRTPPRTNLPATTHHANNTGFQFSSRLPSGSSSTAAANPTATQTNCRLKVVSRSRPQTRLASNSVTVKSFYITPFHVEQSEEDVIEYLRENINIDNATLECETSST